MTKYLIPGAIGAVIGFAVAFGWCNQPGGPPTTTVDTLWMPAPPPVQLPPIIRRDTITAYDSIAIRELDSLHRVIPEQSRFEQYLAAPWRADTMVNTPDGRFWISAVSIPTSKRTAFAYQLPPARIVDRVTIVPQSIPFVRGLYVRGDLFTIYGRRVFGDGYYTGAAGLTLQPTNVMIDLEPFRMTAVPSPDGYVGHAGFGATLKYYFFPD